MRLMPCSGALVQPRAGMAALRQAMRDRALELVDPLVQRPDPLDDMRAARGRSLTVPRFSLRPGARVVADPRHSTSLAGVST